MRWKRRLLNVVLVTAFFSTVLFAQQQGWLGRFFPKKGPQVVNGDPSKPLIEPPAGVLALQDSFAKVVETVKPAVVNIAAVQIARVQQEPQEFFYGDPEEFFRRFFGEMPEQRQQPRPREYKREGTGSGVIIDPEGFILTNNHVVQDADQLTVTLSNDKTYKGKVVGTDPRTDLAVIRVKGSSAFPYVQLGDSSKARVGDWVLAFGSPFGLQQTVTSGIISAIRQSLNIEGKAFRNLLQTDAAINRGNSGGPLVNLRGELIGINTAIYAPTGVFSGIGFAIPVNDAKIILKDLIEKGYVERSWMGVEIGAVDEVIANQFGLKSTEGALVNQVMAGSPADKAGLKRGDAIVEFDGKKAGTVQALQDIVSATPPGRSVTVKVVRSGETKALVLKTEAMPKQVADGSLEEDNQGTPKEETRDTVEWLGATFVKLTPQLQERYGIEKGNSQTGLRGVVATSAPPNSVAAEAGLQEGDLLQAVNRVPVRDLNDIKKLKKDTDVKKGLVFDLIRRGRSFYLSYKSVQ